MKSDDPQTRIIPLVTIEGFLSATSSIDWPSVRGHLREHKKYLGDRDVLQASVGPVSSLHDRACELYFAIKGGTVDYGEEHARQYDHKRYGRECSIGLYPAWSTSRPLHFLGHSMGGTTIVKLQSLLSQGFFGPDNHPDMVLSVTTVSAPFRGTQVVYALGERTDSAPAVRPFSIGSVLAKGVHVLSYLAPLLPQALDLHPDSRSLSYREATFFSLLKHLWRSDWAEGRDATPYDVTFEAADDRESNGEGVCNPKSYYRSYVTQMTERNSTGDLTHSPSSRYLLLPPLYLSAKAVGSFDFSVLRPLPSFVPFSTSDIEVGSKGDREIALTEFHWANDGLVPVFSQWHPHGCTSTKCSHRGPSNTMQYDQSVEPGVWHVYTLTDAHHLTLLPLWLGTTRQRDFWVGLREFLCYIDSKQLG